MDTAITLEKRNAQVAVTDKQQKLEAITGNSFFL
jgi:hypothetical protein